MKENMTTNNKPAYEIFVVREGSNKKSYFIKIGAAWPTKSGSGYNADLIALPVDGKFILLPPKNKEDVSEKIRSQGGGLRLAAFLRRFNSGETSRFDGGF